MNGFLDHLLEHYELTNNTIVLVRILDLILPLSQVKSSVKFNFVARLLASQNVHEHVTWVLSKIDELDTNERKLALEKLIERLISSGSYDSVLSQCGNTQIELVN